MNFPRWSSGLPLWRLVPVCIVLLCPLGCGESADQEEVDFSRLVPVQGVVKINGEAVPGVVVTWLPKQWGASVGETDADGSYSLETAMRPGAFPGEYKVAVSYLVSAEGEPQGLAARGSMTPLPGMATAKEQLPPKYSSLDHTELTGTVGPAGGTFDFNLDVEDFNPTPEAPSPEEPKAAEPEPKPAEPEADAP